MRLSRFLHTVSHLTPEQIIYQVRNRVFRPRYVPYRAPSSESLLPGARPIAKYPCFSAGRFTFLNVTAPFVSWSDVRYGLLWTYNLNYAEWLEQMSVEEACRWLDRYMDEFPSNSVGQDPYPTALRTLNWCKFFVLHPDCLTAGRRDALYSQYRLLVRRLEYHLSGNHLLEDALALTAGAIMFSDRDFWRKGSSLLRRCLAGQILSDGAHYEQSPMYHCILLDRLLDVYNLSVSNLRFGDQQELEGIMKAVSVRMLGHLENMVLSDGDIPLMNDSAHGTAPAPREIFDYARRLSLEWTPIELGECGYRHFRSERMEAVMDVGGITASEQPGHTHADTFSYVLYVDGRPYIVDTGISTYEKNARRQYERSTAAHNTVEVEGRDSSDVWGGFRVGRMAPVEVLEDGMCSLEAVHYGYGAGVFRSFSMEGDVFRVKDSTDAPGVKVSHIHFAPGVSAEPYEDGIRTSVGNIIVEGADAIEIADGKISASYGTFEDIREVRISFFREVTYRIYVGNSM